MKCFVHHDDWSVVVWLFMFTLFFFWTRAWRGIWIWWPCWSESSETKMSVGPVLAESCFGKILGRDNWTILGQFETISPSLNITQWIVQLILATIDCNRLYTAPSKQRPNTNKKKQQTKTQITLNQTQDKTNKKQKHFMFRNHLTIKNVAK